MADVAPTAEEETKGVEERWAGRGEAEAEGAESEVVVESGDGVETEGGREWGRSGEGGSGGGLCL